MNNINETHPFLVSVWVPGNDNPQSLFEHGRWMEEARCITLPRAEEVALCLAIRHHDGVQIAELTQNDKGVSWSGIKYIPASAVLHQERKAMA